MFTHKTRERIKLVFKAKGWPVGFRKLLQLYEITSLFNDVKVTIPDIPYLFKMSLLQ